MCQQKHDTCKHKHNLDYEILPIPHPGIHPESERPATVDNTELSPVSINQIKTK